MINSNHTPPQPLHNVSLEMLASVATGRLHLPRTIHFHEKGAVRHSLGARKGTIALSMAKHPSKAELQSLPGVAKERDAATKGFLFQQTMFRIKDPERSLDFYTRVMGLTLLEKLDFADAKFTLLFLGQYDAEEIPEDPSERTEWTFSRAGCLELTHNWGTEKEDREPYYHNGNKDPQGFGHIGFDVPDVESACKRFESLGVSFVKKPSEGRMKDIAFIQDPDGYWIEIFNSKANKSLVS